MSLGSMVRKLFNKHQGDRVVPVTNESITLFHLEREDITIDIVARFDGDKLIIDGYDIGKTVKDAWGDSDYEYSTTIPAPSLPLLYELLNVKTHDRIGLLRAIEERFHGNRCWSLLNDFLAENDVAHDTSTWA